MCGIAGALLWNSETSVPLAEMIQTLRHRGPDGEGYLATDPETGKSMEYGGQDTEPSLHLPLVPTSDFSGPCVLLGHRRLSVLDLTVKGHQPMPDSEKRFWIIFNGEIYNYLELRDELKALGFTFLTGTDTEVILASYRQWGEDCLHRFNGMWAFAIWDIQEKRLFAARDRFGVKPFYFVHQNRDFFFASEIKALLKIQPVKKEINEKKIFDFLIWNLLQEDGETCFSGIHSLQAGSCLTLPWGGVLRIKKWYELPATASPIRYEANTAGVFAERLRDAVQIRQRSDIPVGSCLSGGLDSSSIVCLANRDREKAGFHTFSACYESKPCDERTYIEEVNRQTGATAHYVFPDFQGFRAEWKALMYHQEEPFGSSSIFAQWEVMKTAGQKQVHVLLDGQGADELLGGYLRYRVNRTASLLAQKDIRGYGLALRHPLALLLWGIKNIPVLSDLAYRVKSVCSSRYWQKAFLNRHEARARAYVRERAVSQKNLSTALAGDFFQYSLPALLRYEDKNSMAFSVETRHPFLDYRLVEKSFQLEESAKIDTHETKRILRDSMKGILPEKVRRRKDKIGFATPEAEWMNAGKAQFQDLLEKNRPVLNQWIDMPAFLQAFEKESWNAVTWRILNVAMWLEVFFPRENPTL